MEIEELVICGMMRHMCVDTTVRSTKRLGFEIELLSDACTTRDLLWENTLIPDGKLQRFSAHKTKVKSTPKLEISADGISLGKSTCVIKMHRKALRVFASPIGLGDENPQAEGEEEFICPTFSFY